MAEASKTSFTDTPEFKAAVQEAAEAAVAAALAIRPGEPPKGDGPDWIPQLAMAISTLSQQGIGSKSRAAVPPAVLKARSDARERMFGLLNKARAEGRIPLYRVTSKTLLDNTLVEPFWIDANHIAQPVEVQWPGVPNEVMIPLNDVAKEIFAAFEASIGTIQSDDAAQLQAFQKHFDEPQAGLVIKTSPGLQRRMTGNEKPDDPALLTGLSLKHRDQPGRYKEVKILGSIAEPARQSI